MLDILKRRLSSAIGKYEWNGETVFLKRLQSSSWIRIQALASEEADNNQAQAVAFFVELLAITLCTENGLCDCDSDEGRESLRQLGFRELDDLAKLALHHSGLEAKEKN